MINIAVIGAGVISEIYLSNLKRLFHKVRVIGICDIVCERARAAAERFDISKVYATPEQVFADREVQVVLNLTRPIDHYALTRAALMAGKHVYSEKTLAVRLEEGVELVQLAKERGLYLGGAPDTFLGAGLQTCRKLIDEGWIGKPIDAMCTMLCHGHESWHPAPEFYYQSGGGPMLDMGPYYMTALIHLLGEVRVVSAITGKASKKRIITSQPQFGKIIDVEVDTHDCGVILFRSGAIASVVMSFDVHCAPQNQSRFEIYGTEGTLLVPDPNTFGGTVELYRPEAQPRSKAVDPGQLQASRLPIGYSEIPLSFGYSENSRALGLAEMCRAIEKGRPARANCDLQLHVLETILAFETSSRSGKACEIQSTCPTIPAMRSDLPEGILD